eukprot:TRINITY_DN4810_c2_g1_i1.p1 TRINITY_DN4810_c2_g1~~TRINITY_DN4810_c2_g1_i1.p1  ORF type:complete len:695 (+),score=135.22 TRINITY_DN4810_c2_g1_i1:48-2132(+)
MPEGWLVPALLVVILALMRNHPFTQRAAVKVKSLWNEGGGKKQLRVDTDLEEGSNGSPGQGTLRERGRKTVGLQLGSLIDTPKKTTTVSTVPSPFGTPSCDTLELELKRVQHIQQLTDDARAQTLTTMKMLEHEIALAQPGFNHHSQTLLSHKTRLLQQQSEQLQTTVDLHLQQQEILSKMAARHTTPKLTPQDELLAPLEETVPQGRQLFFSRTKSDLRSDHIARQHTPVTPHAHTPTSLQGDFPVLKVPRRMSARGSPRSGKQTTQKWIRGDLIGKGGFGMVHIAMDLTDGGKMVAVKNVPIGLHEPADKRNARLASLKTEIELMKSLSHPNIVRYKGAEREGDSLNIFMEYVSGGSIAGLLKMFGPLTEDVAIAYTYQVLSGLKYLHSCDVVHRDIKGANILLTVDGVCKLADFGAATQVGLDVHTSFVGTPNWMSPEMIRQEGHSQSADIWSLGCTVMEMLTGSPPWSRISDKAKTIQILHYVTSDSNFEEEIQKVMEGCCDERGLSFVMQCIQKDPADRPKVEELIEHEWMAILEDPPEETEMETEGAQWKIAAQEAANKLKESLGGANGATGPPSPTIALVPLKIRRPPDFRNSHSPDNQNLPQKTSSPTFTIPEVASVESSVIDPDEDLLPTLPVAKKSPETANLRSPIRGPGSAPSPQAIAPMMHRVSVQLLEDEACFFTDRVISP